MGTLCSGGVSWSSDETLHWDIFMIMIWFGNSAQGDRSSMSFVATSFRAPNPKFLCAFYPFAFPWLMHRVPFMKASWG